MGILFGGGSYVTVNPADPNDLSLVVQLISKNNLRSNFDTICIIPLTNKNDQEIKVISLGDEANKESHRMFISSNGKSLTFTCSGSNQDLATILPLENNSKIEVKELPQLIRKGIYNVYGLISLSKANINAVSSPSK